MGMKLSHGAVAIVAAACSLHAWTQAPAGGMSSISGSLLILSKHDRTLSIVDPATLRVTAKTLVGDDPHEVIASADGRTAWVSNYGFGSLHTLTVVDLLAGKALQRVDLGPLTGPHGLAFAAGETWFTAEGAKALARLDPATNKIDLIVGTGQNRTHMIYVSPDAKRIVTTNVSSGTVSLIDAVPVTSIEPQGPPPGALPGPPPGTPPPSGPQQSQRTEWNETVVPVGHGSEGFDVSPDGREIWVGNAGDGTVSVVDWQARKVFATLQANARGVNRLKFTPDGRYALLSAGPELVVIDAHTRTVTKRIALGHGSGGILVEPGGLRAFVACSPDNYVAVIDLKTLAVTGRIDAGPDPDGLAWAARQ